MASITSHFMAKAMFEFDFDKGTSLHICDIPFLQRVVVVQACGFFPAFDLLRRFILGHVGTH